jgi:hypothetical protein
MMSRVPEFGAVILTAHLNGGNKFSNKGSARFPNYLGSQNEKESDQSPSILSRNKFV